MNSGKKRGQSVSLEHIDPIRHTLICGMRNDLNEILASLSYNARKTNRFVPYRVCDHPTPVTFGDMCEFLIEGEWVVCEFGGEIWWSETNRVGNATTHRNWLGKKHTEETKAKISASLKGHDPLPSETLSEMGKKGGAKTRDSGKLRKASVLGGLVQGKRNKGMMWFHQLKDEKIIRKRSKTLLPEPWVRGRG